MTKRRKEGQAENSIPPKTPFSGTGKGGGGGLKARDISKLKQSEYQGADYSQADMRLFLLLNICIENRFFHDVTR